MVTALSLHTEQILQDLHLGIPDLASGEVGDALSRKGGRTTMGAGTGKEGERRGKERGEEGRRERAGEKAVNIPS